jgi:ATP-dependent DNA helicase DinG
MNTPRELGLPFDDWRPGQRLAIRTALHSKTRHTVIQSPTGSGKSTIAAALSMLTDERTAILTATKGLEDQYSGTFPFLYDVRGMSNYECLAARDELKSYFTVRHFVASARRRGSAMPTCEDGPCRSGIPCSLKENGCLYFDRYRGALASVTPLTNYPYWMAMRRFAKGLGPCRRVILDEAHALPEQLMNNCRIELRLALVDGNLPTTHARWRSWATAKLDSLKPENEAQDDVRVRRRQLTESLEQITQIDHTWAWDVLDDRVVFEPVIPRLLLPYLFDPATAQQVVYLSATITPATLRLLDIPPEDITFKVMRSRFPVERRPVYLVESCRVDHKMGDIDRAHWLGRIDKIIRKRLDRRGIIHTVSYQRAQDILAASEYRGMMIAPRRASELAAAVAAYRAAKPPVILLSPSVVTGWDFPYRDCEYQILAKTPFPDTRSAIARARIEATEGYRDHLTASAIVQAAGRGMRAEDDQCETFIVDDHSRWFIRQANNQEMLPAWFTEAIQWVAQPPPPPAHL